MRVSIIAIGNSKGIRIPKPLLEESGLTKEVELLVKPGEIRITPVKRKKKPAHSLAIASEAALAQDWLRPEEEEAWENLQ